MNKTALFVFVFFCISCASNKPFYNPTVSNWQNEITSGAEDPEYSVYLLGDSRLTNRHGVLNLESLLDHFRSGSQGSRTVPGQRKGFAKRRDMDKVFLPIGFGE